MDVEGKALASRAPAVSFLTAIRDYLLRGILVDLAVRRHNIRSKESNGQWDRGLQIMATKKDDKPAGKDDSEVWSAIAAFEQILEAMPNDRTSIETLAHAYEQIGDLSRAKEYVLRLANVIVAEQDRDAAGGMLEKVQSYVAEDPAAADVAKKLKELTEKAQKAKPAKAEPGQREAKPVKQEAAAAGVATGFNIANELPFAWNLLQANEITQEEYSAVVQDLTDMSGTDATVTVSVLHVLNDRGFKNLGRIVASVAKDCGTPVIALSSFDLQSESFSLLPLDFMIKRGAIVFELFGREALAVVLNPYDKQLMKDVETLSGRKCYFYLTQPFEFDGAISKIKGWFEQSSAAEKEKEKEKGKKP